MRDGSNQAWCKARRGAQCSASNSFRDDATEPGLAVGSQSPIGHTGLMLREPPLVMFSQTAANEEQSAVRMSLRATASIARSCWRTARIEFDVVYGKYMSAPTTA